MKMFRWGLLLVALLLMPLTGSAQQVQDYSKAKNAFRSSPEVRWFFENAYGYALFPVVGKAALIIGGAYGEGQVYRNGKVTGTANLIHGSIGFQWGGQAYSEFIFFKDDAAIANFRRGNFEFGAQASAVAATAGASADTSYDKGVAVFTHAAGGLMVEGSVGGQRFTYVPKQ